MARLYKSSHEKFDSELHYTYSIDPSSFSAKGLACFREKVDYFIAQLILESKKVASGHLAETVSSKHVKLANDRMTAAPSQRFRRHAGTVGGIFLGVSLPKIIDYLECQCPFDVISLAMVGLAVIGTSMITLHISKT